MSSRLLKPPDGGFRTIVADPPWQFQLSCVQGAAENHYSTMSDDSIVSMDVKSVAADSSHLYLWIVAAKAELGYAVCRSWGFRPIMELWWVKRAPQLTLIGPPPRYRMGMGFYFRHSGERCIFGVRGKGRLLRKDLDAIMFEAPRRHSQKPDVFYQLVERASPGPRLELFSRTTRPGWIVWGNETGKFNA